MSDNRNWIHIVMAGDDHYPRQGSGNWINVFTGPTAYDDAVACKNRCEASGMYDWVEIASVNPDTGVWE